MNGPRQDWIFTFGVGHESPGHGRLGHRFVRIHGTWNEARREMVRRHGQTWAFQYPSEEAAGVKKWQLIELVEEVPS